MVTGTVGLSGNTAITGTLDVTGNSKITGVVALTGSTSITGGNLGLTGDLDVTLWRVGARVMFGR